MADYIDRYIPQSYLFGALGVPIDGACGKCHQTRTDCMCQSLSRMDICGIIEDAPVADVRENVHGEWVKDSDGIPVCSECGEVALQRMFIKPPNMMVQVDLVLSDFCPNCGADMREVDDDNK